MIFYDCATAPSPRRARILLAEKQVSHTVKQVDLAKGEQLGDAFKAINPACTVPVLQLDDGTIITENAGIAAFLESEYPELPLLGKTSKDKAAIASWTAQIEFEGLFAIAEALRNSSPAMQNRAIAGANNYEQIPELAERGLARLKVFFDKLEQRLQGREFIATDAFTNADITAMVAVDFARIVRVKPQEQHINLKRWHAELSQRPSFSV